MRRIIGMTSAAGLLGMLLFVAPALAANPAQDAYGALSGATGSTGGTTTTSGTLPFTGLNLAAILALAVIMLAIGVAVRVRATRSN
jgi:hypothetical protein